jgi:triosephosphate isomerase
MAPRTLIAGNWKMNGLGNEGLVLARAVAGHAKTQSFDCEVLICPPATLLRDTARALADSPVALGGQDCHTDAKGAHTGDVSAEMLKDAGCTYVIVGHSERRTDHGETDALVRAKAEAAHRSGLVAIVCIGETAAQRDGGQTLAVVARQLVGSVPDGARATDTVIAYEPVWAIGTGRTPTAAEIGEVHGRIRADLTARFRDGAEFRILYGGSVNAKNAPDILRIPEVNGALVGGASLDDQSFLAICRSAD